MSLKLTKNEIDTKDMSNEDWLRLRRNSIGGSDAGAILGFNKYESPYSLYCKKVYPETFEEDLSDNDAIHFGNVLEDVVAKEFAARTGKKVRKHNKMMYHDKHEFMSANVDRVIIGEKAILECKTANQYKDAEWKDGNVPASYMAQCYHYLAVTGLERAYIAVLIGGQKFVWTTIERDDEVIHEIIESEKDFWFNHVMKQVPPETDDTEATSDALNQLWGVTNDNVLSIDEEQNARFRAMISIDKQIKELQQEKRGHQNKLKALLGESEFGQTYSYKATWKPQTRKSVDTKRLKEEQPEIYEQYMKESKSRVLKVSEL